MAQERAETFAETVARVAARPTRPARVPVGRHGEVWGAPDGTAFKLVDADLDPARALALAAGGASVVFDACGCGGAECALDWLSDADVRDLARGDAPMTTGPARLEHWRNESGSELVVAAIGVSWGDRIPG